MREPGFQAFDPRSIQVGRRLLAAWVMSEPRDGYGVSGRSARPRDRPNSPSTEPVILAALTRRANRMRGHGRRELFIAVGAHPSPSFAGAVLVVSLRFAASAGENLGG